MAHTYLVSEPIHYSYLYVITILDLLYDYFFYYDRYDGHQLNYLNYLKMFLQLIYEHDNLSESMDKFFFPNIIFIIRNNLISIII